MFVRSFATRVFCLPSSHMGSGRNYFRTRVKRSLDTRFNASLKKGFKSKNRKSSSL
jgi:hypothetical protein